MCTHTHAHTHTHTHAHTYNVNRAPEGEMNTEWRRVIQSKEWDGDESPTLSLARRKKEDKRFFYI